MADKQSKSSGGGVERDRRSVNRDRNANWESKTVGRVLGRLRNLPAEKDQPTSGWESAVLDTLRKRIGDDLK